MTSPGDATIQGVEAVVDVTLLRQTPASPTLNGNGQSGFASSSNFPSRETFNSRHSWGENQSRHILDESDHMLKKPRAASDGQDFLNHSSWRPDGLDMASAEVLANTYIEMTHAVDVHETKRVLALKISQILRVFKITGLCATISVIFLLVLIGVDLVGGKELSVKFYYFAGAVLTIISCIYIFTTYRILGNLNRHPGSLHVWGAACDLIISIPFIIQLFDDSPEKTEESNNEGGSLCRTMSFVTQVGLFGSVTWFGLLSIDLYKTLRKPFISHAKQVKFYHIFAWTISLVSGVVLLVRDEPGVSNVCVCWVASKSTDEINLSMWLLYYSFVCIYFVFSIGVLIYCVMEWKVWFSRQSSDFFTQMQDEATKATINMRKTIIRNSALHILSYLAYFAVLFLLYNTYDKVREQGESEDGKSTYVECHPEKQEFIWLLKIFAMLVSSKGVVDAIVWYYKSNLGNLTLELALQIEIPQQYRKDVMRCTLTGIRDTALMAAGPNIDDIYHQRYFQCLLEMNVQGTSTQYSFVFRSYAMLVFRHIREASGITTESYLQSLCGSSRGELSITEDLVEMFSEGKSGSFLYFSKDKRFIIKTMSHGEKDVLLSVLKEYHGYISRHPDTLISRLYGLHSIVISGVVMYFVVMENVIHIPPDRLRLFTFDMKGSWVDREVGIGNSNSADSRDKSKARVDGFRFATVSNERDAESTAEPATSQIPKGPIKKTLKDIDFAKVIGNISIGSEMKARLIRQIEEDTQFFCSLGIMDYSLLLAVSEGSKPSRDRKASRRQSSTSLAPVNSPSTLQPSSSSSHIGVHAPFFRTYNGGIEERTDEERMSCMTSGLVVDRAFHLGIIDIFQEYNFEKKTERWFKVHMRCKDDRGISCTMPEDYAQRFVEMIERILK